MRLAWEGDGFVARSSAGNDFDTGFGNFKMLSEKFDKSSVSLTVVGAGPEINGVRAVVVFDNFFLAGARFDSGFYFHFYTLLNFFIITR